MRRFIMLLTAVALVVALVALTAMPAFAQGLVSVDLGETSVSALNLLNVKLGATHVGVL